MTKDDPLYASVDNVSVCGLTTRELFAAMAMQGLLSGDGEIYSENYSYSAQVAVKHADALIAELAKKTT